MTSQLPELENYEIAHHRREVGWWPVGGRRSLKKPTHPSRRKRHDRRVRFSQGPASPLALLQHRLLLRTAVWLRWGNFGRSSADAAFDCWHVHAGSQISVLGIVPPEFEPALVGRKFHQLHILRQFAVL